jgi:hypothetical protein
MTATAPANPSLRKVKRGKGGAKRKYTRKPIYQSSSSSSSSGTETVTEDDEEEKMELSVD